MRTVPDTSDEDSNPQMTSIYTSPDVKEHFTKFAGGSRELELIHVATFYEIIGKIRPKEEYESNESFKMELARDYATLTMQQKQKATTEVRETKATIEQTSETKKESVDKAFMVFQDLLDTKLVPEWLLCVKACCKTAGHVAWDWHRSTKQEARYVVR